MMERINKYIVLEGENGITLHGNNKSVVSFNPDEYRILFEGTLTELKKSEYKHLIK